MKYIFLVCLTTMLASSAFADLIQCDQNAADGMTYILASSNTTAQGIIVSQNNSKGGTETVITTKAQAVSLKGMLSWSVPVAEIDWTLPQTKSVCTIYNGVSFTFVIDNSHDELSQGKPAAAALHRRTNFAHNPKMAPCQPPEAFPAPPTRFTCHAL